VGSAVSTTIIVTKNDQGGLEGVGQKCKQALHRFQRWVERLEPGEIFTMDVWMPRNPKFHKLHFVMLAAVFDAQEQFADAEHLRLWLQTGAGYCKLLPGPNGKPVAIPDSIAWSKMDDIAFGEHHQRVKDFLRSPRATGFLWPHLPPHEASNIVEGILAEFEA
jgi:hypothetical protein